ncbi:MAG: inositol monophosphatase family protein [Candidatus Margulisiibacteriota bacterium]|jgi:fructose-1,6-bisphosphatase/inositol monophosphatase family enzyme
MNQWHPPTINNKNLYLPILSKNLAYPLNIYRANTDYYLEISDAFINIWHQGPKNDLPENILDCIVILGKTFCDLISQAQGKTNFQSKTRPDDLVTEVDTGLEMLFRLWINKFLPNHKVIGEEGEKEKILATDTVWYLDPVDGTNNYVKGKSDVGINICCFKEGTPLLSFVGAPFYKKYFYGTAEISYQEKDKIKTKLSFSPNIKSNLICTEIDENEAIDHQILKNILTKNNLKDFQTKCIAIDLINLIEGNILAFYKNNVKIWDIAAPLSLLKYISNDFNFDFYIHHKFDTPIHFFANDAKFLASLNTENKLDSKFGFILVTPKNKPEIKELILNEYRQNY